MRILICGDRDWKDVDYVWKTLTNVVAIQDDVFVLDDGLGSIARLCAEGIGANVTVLDGKTKVNPQTIYCYHRYINNSTRSKAIIERAKKKKIPVHILSGAKP